MNGLEGVHNVNMGCSSLGCRRIGLKSLQDSGERLECIGQSSRVDGCSHKSTTLTTFEAKVSRSNGQRGLADRELMKDSCSKEEYCYTIAWDHKPEMISMYDCR